MRRMTENAAAPVAPRLDLDALEATARAAATLAPGDWFWRGNTDYEEPSLNCMMPSKGRVEITGHVPVDREAGSFEADLHLRRFKDLFSLSTTEEDARRHLDEWLWADRDYEVPNTDSRLSVTDERNVKQPVRDLAVFEVARHRGLPDDTPRTHSGIHRGEIVDVRNPVAKHLAAASADTVLALIGRVREQSSAAQKVLKLHDTIWYDQWKHEVYSDQGYGGRCELCLGFDGAACDTVLALGGFPADE